MCLENDLILEGIIPKLSFIAAPADLEKLYNQDEWAENTTRKFMAWHLIRAMRLWRIKTNSVQWYKSFYELKTDWQTAWVKVILRLKGSNMEWHFAWRSGWLGIWLWEFRHTRDEGKHTHLLMKDGGQLPYFMDKRKCDICPKHYPAADSTYKRTKPYARLENSAIRIECTV